MSFVVNGRFYGQRLTGVQRYAREIVLAMDNALAKDGRSGRIMMPARAPRPTDLRALTICPIAPFDGYLWEQLVLPARSRAPILNLCNTAPALEMRQIVCMHDANVFEQPESYSRLFRAAYYRLMPLLAQRAARITTVSHAAARQLALHLPLAERDIVVLPNGHEHVFRWRPEASAMASQFQHRRPFVLILGSKARHKNAALILNQADALDALGLDLVVAGGGSGIFSDIPTVTRPNVRLLGFVSDDDLAFLYRRALCLAFPSFTEGFGLPIVEAMALGCPVVSSDRASMPEVCGSAALFASPEEPEGWRRHFAALVASRDLVEDLKGRGHERVRHFSWTDSADGYLSLLATL